MRASLMVTPCSACCCDDWSACACDDWSACSCCDWSACGSAALHDWTTCCCCDGWTTTSSSCDDWTATSSCALLGAFCALRTSRTSSSRGSADFKWPFSHLIDNDFDTLEEGRMQITSGMVESLELPYPMMAAMEEL